MAHHPKYQLTTYSKQDGKILRISQFMSLAAARRLERNTPEFIDIVEER